jgi:hypothetical protein
MSQRTFWEWWKGWNADNWWPWYVPYIMAKEQIDQRIQDNREIIIDNVASKIMTINGK